MEPRIDYARRYPELRHAMWALEHYVHQSGLDPKLLELVKLRASLINGCAYCVDMHTKVARSLGETSSGCTKSVSGGRRRSTPIGNAPRSAGPKP